MSNNLKKLEKELRSIAKRCKDVKYTKGLLLSFLFMGLFAFSLQASSISPITSMWENYNREKAENDRAMEKANDELLMLMKQGDHVVKSAWPSWQFGFNFMANSQLGVYKGFGGKYEDRKYDRSNDLTKYVFDASKNQYGATTLNIKGNEEAKSMVIDPASVHIRNYTNNPAEVTKLDVLGMASDPVFNYDITSPSAGNYEKNISVSAVTRTIATPTSTSTAYNASSNTGHAGVNSITTNNSATITTTGASYYSTAYQNGTTGTPIGNTNSGTIGAMVSTVTPVTDITSISGEFSSGIDGLYSEHIFGHGGSGTGNGSGSTYGSMSDTWYGFVTVNDESEGTVASSVYGSNQHSGVHGHDMTYQYGIRDWNETSAWWKSTPTSYNSPERNNIILANNDLTIKSSTFSIGTAGKSITKRNGIKVISGNLTIVNPLVTNRNGYDSSGNTQWKNRSKTIFNIGAYESNGILVTGANSQVTTNSGTEFNVNGTYSTGIHMAVGTGKADIRSTIFSVNNSSNGLLINSGNTANTVNTSGFTVYSGNGINLYNGAATVSSSNFTVGSGNGIYAHTGTTLSSVSGSTFTVNGGNGILKNASTSTAISSSTFNVNGAGATGITYNGSSTAETISGSTFNVRGGNASTGIHMINTAKIDIEPTTTFTVSNASIGIEVENNGIQTKTINFKGKSTTEYTDIILSGNDNIAVNINSGTMNGTNDVNKKVHLIPSASSEVGLDITISGDSNIGYNNTGYINELKIESGKTPMPLNFLTGHGRIKIGTYNSGNNTITGHHSNVIFANQGYVESGNVNLKQIEVDGNKNTIAYFAQGNGNYATSGLHGTSNAGVGFFNGNAFEIQGVIGVNDTSQNNVAVYASSGQRSGISTGHINQTNAATLTDLKITNLNIGVGSKAANTTLVYANNGTVVEVRNTLAAADGSLNPSGNTISDGQGYNVDGNSKNNWGYYVPYGHLSTGTTIAYADGVFDNGVHKFLNNMDAYKGLASEVKILSNVDMTSKEGTAYRAANGGQVTVGETATPIITRAGGYNSIIAYAEGTNVNQKQPTLNPITYETMKSFGNSTGLDGSTVVIYGNITAADNSIFSTNVGGLIDRANAYKNIGAYAVDGGDVIIKNSAVKPQGLNGFTKEESDKAAGVQGSLIYGLGAYASGEGSNVIFEKATTASATIVTGTNGALYATNKGYIEFSGNIIHQNNAGNGISTGATADGAGITATVESRKGRNVGGNDHTNVPVFYVKRTSSTDDAGITFNAATKIDMYDGYFLTGNEYQHRPSSTNDFLYNSYSDYYKDAQRPAAPNDVAWDRARYRGMSNVTLNLVKGGEIDLGLINQSEKELEWDNNQDKTAGKYLETIGEYAGITVGNLKNGANTNTNSTSTATKFTSTLINSELKITTNVELENYAASNAQSGAKSAVSGAAATAVDPFNNITMESTKVTIDSSAKVYGDLQFKAGQGLNMANSLNRWDKLNDDNSTWRKTENTESGYVNKGTVSVWGGSKTSAITGINVAYGTVENDTAAKVYVDHGYGIVGTDDSILTNKGKIVITGKYDPVGQDSVAGTGLTNSAKIRNGLTAETVPSGENYGIVGISTNNVRENSSYGGYRYGNNAVTIKNIANASDGIIEVDGELAVGIFAKNVNQSGNIRYPDGTNDRSAKKSDINITYNNQNATSADAIKVNHGAGVANTATQDNKKLRGVGIALVEADKDTTAADRGGTITLNTKGGSTSDILTYHNGIGIYGESTDIVFDSASAGLTVETKNNGAGLWMTDDSNVGKLANKEGDKVFNYLYKGDADKNGFGMIFGSTIPSLSTTATNWLDIKFTNTGATKEGIAGILVNTDENDRVINYGKITEDTSTTAEKAYGVVVNKGTVENHGDIELNDSTDITKANVGIFANSNDLTADIVNYGNIKVGTPGSTKSFGIYGYDITHGTREDALSPISGKGGTITIGKESYGIYSGDGTVKVTGGKLIVGDSTVTTASEQAVGVYIDDNTRLSKSARSGEVSADMEIDDYSFGIVVAENQNAKLPGASNTNYLTLGKGTYSVDSAGRTSSLMSTKTPEIIVGRAASRTPVDPDVDPLHTTYTSNSVYYYSADKLSKVDSWADIKMNGDYNYAFYTAGVANNMGTIDLRSKVDVASGSANLGYGNVGIYSTNYSAGASTNYGTITTGMSDLLNEEYSIGMAAGHYNKKTKEITREGHVVNRGIINVQEENGIGMFAVGSNSKAENYGDINLIGNNSIGMYLDRKATGINYGNIVTTGSGTGIKGIVALNGSIIKNYGTIKIEGNGGIAIQTDNLQNKTDNQTNDVYKGTETGTQESIQYVASSDTKTVGTGSTITVPSSVPLTEVKINGIDTPIFKVDTDATRLFGTATQATVVGSVQSGGTRIIDLSTWGDFGNTRNLAEATRIGMYVDTSGFQYTNPIDGLDNLKNLYEIDLLFGTEATMYTNSKAIQLGDNILTAYNDALKQVVTGGTTLKGLSSSITWLAKPVFNETTGLIDTVYLVKVPYQSYAVEGDDLTYYFAENLESKYDIASGNDKIIFNKLNSIGNGEGHILAQAIDEMKGHQYSNIQQRGQVTRDILFKEINYLRNEWANPSKDSNKIKSFGTKGEYKTDSAGVKDYNNNAYGVAYIHENETLSLGEKSGWYAGAVYNSFNFKDLGGSEEDQALINAGLFKSTPFDQNGSLTWTISGDAYVGLNNMRRRFWVVDKIFSSRANYVSYGIGITNEIAKEFGSVTGSGFSYKPYASVRVEYGRFTDIEEKGDMALEVKGNDYYSIRPEIGMQVKYSQPVFSGKTNFVAGFGVAVENELGKIGDAQNKARISGVYGNYYKLKGEKENRKGNLKTDLSIGLDNRRIGFAINVGYDTKGENLRGGISFRGMF